MKDCVGNKVDIGSRVWFIIGDCLALGKIAEYDDDWDEIVIEVENKRYVRHRVGIALLTDQEVPANLV